MKTREVEMRILIPQRTVIFMGLKLVVPLDTKYLTMDSYGVIEAFSDRPWTEPDCYEGEELGEIIKIDPPKDIDWRDTLTEYEPIATY